MTKLAEGIKRLEKTGGALCRCRLSGIPNEIEENL